MKKDVINYLVDSLGLSGDELPEFYDTFIASFDECAQELSGLTSFTDFMGIRRITHTLIGFSQNVGAMDLFEAARTLNAAAKAEDPPACEAATRALLQLHAAYKAEN